jgi:hypothetical protein
MTPKLVLVHVTLELPQPQSAQNMLSHRWIFSSTRVAPLWRVFDFDRKCTADDGL